MTEPSMTLRNADTEDLDRVETLLEANGLPYEDVRSKPECFFVAVAEAEVIGVGGVELHGSNGLLRSVVVEESARGRGFGATLCDELENYARTNEVDALYLLTTTASGFFRRRGYEVIARDETPDSIQQTTEFTDLCPASATAMRKDLP